MKKPIAILRQSIGILLSLGMIFAVQGCATKLWPFGEKTEKHPDAETSLSDESPSPDEDGGQQVGGKSRSKSRAVKSADLELKQARLWNRLDDLEEQVRVQKEQIKLLEQGLLTGIPPEDLKKTSKSKSAGRQASKDKTSKKLLTTDDDNLASPPAPILDLPQKVASSGDSNSADAPDSYRVRMQVAKDYYQASRFGLAVAELAQITRAFGTKVGDGEAKFYLGRSYLGLKEYLTSRTELEAFIKEFPNSPHRGLARLDLARAYAGLNLRERARKELASVAKEYDGQDEGDMAASELRNMKGTL